MLNLTGKVLKNRYILLEKLGEGGTAVVYKAKCQLLNRYVAVKILRDEYTHDEDFVKKFRRESLAAASLSHPNIVGVYDVGEENNIYYIVMEYVKGKTLKNYIKEKGRINYPETLNIIKQIVRALDHAHRNGVVHRDIKPHNIIINEDGIAKVTDFGIARATSSATVTNNGSVMGSVHYFSPEQARGGFTDHRTDIYSLGIVMYEMLTGKLPFDADSPVSIAIKHLQEDFIKPKEIDEDLPEGVNDIVVRCMQKDMSKRYQSAKEILEDLNTVNHEPNKNLLVGKKDVDRTRAIPVNEINDAIKRNGKGNIRKKIIITLLSIFLFIGVALGTSYVYNNFFVVKEVTVPKVTGMVLEEAKKALEDNNLIMELTEPVNSDKPEGEVIRIEPTDGSTVKEGAIVKVTLSAGVKKVKVPDLKNYDQVNAEGALKRLGLKIGKTDRAYSNDVDKDLIMDQSPSKDSEVPVGSEVDIVISDGPEVKFVTVPNLIGKSIDEALNMIQESGLILGKINYSSDKDKDEGIVLEQNIADGTLVKSGQTISITVNKIENNGEKGNGNK